MNILNCPNQYILCLKSTFIGTSTKFKPFKEPEPEIPSVELVTELVEVELQEVSLYLIP